MKTIELLKDRRTYYALNDDVKVEDEKIVKMVEEVTELVPDAFNMKSQRVVLALGQKHNELWDAIYEVFDGKVDRSKLIHLRMDMVQFYSLQICQL